MSPPTPAPMCPQHPDEAMSAVAHPLLRWICVRCALELAGGVSSPGDSAPSAGGRGRPAPAAGWGQRLGARGPRTSSTATLLETLAAERDRLRSLLELVELLTGQGGASRRRPSGSSGQQESPPRRGPALLSQDGRDLAPDRFEQLRVLATDLFERAGEAFGGPDASPEPTAAASPGEAAGQGQGLGSGSGTTDPDRADSEPAEEEGESGPGSLTDVLLEQSPALRAVLDAAQPRWNKLVQALGAEGAGVLDDAASVWRQASSAEERRAPGSTEDSPVSPDAETDDTDEDHPER